jgi:hypothetical protein
MKLENISIMNKKKTGFLILSLVLIHYIACGQLPDGVKATQSFLDKIISNYNEENSFTFDLNTMNLMVNIPIRVHIVKDIRGSAGVTTTNLKSSVVSANNYFKNAGIQFFIDSVDYVNDYNYSCIAYNRLRKELLTKYAIKNRINLFLVDSVKMGALRSYGFTYFPDVADSNYIFLDKNYAIGNSLTTLLGHFMGLLSTHDSEGGRELSDESNCAVSGDFICDTYADPDLFELVIDTCKYIGTNRDDMGKYYMPSVANIMSNSPDNCKCFLTPLQYRRIYYYFHKFRQYLNY